MLCLHCGNVYSFKRQGYCEDCYQKLVAENLKLQIRVKELEKKLEYSPKHMKEEVEEYKLLNNELAQDGIKRHIPFLD